MIRSTTLPSLLQVTLRDLERAYVAEGAGRAGMPRLDDWANLLRAIGDKGCDVRELPAALRLSKRAVQTRLVSAAMKGWIEELKSGRGQRTIRITGSGLQSVAGWKKLQDAAEERWRRVTGVDRTDRLRTAVQDVIARMPLEHPHYPASYGPADATITGGHGRDWKAVLRRPGDTISSLPLSALLSQALVAFAMVYEEKSPAALSLSTTVLQLIPENGRTLRGLGPTAGISGLCRHGFVYVTAGSIYLTGRGLEVTKKCDGWIQEVEAEWCTQFGRERVGKLRQALEDVRRAVDEG